MGAIAALWIPVVILGHVLAVGCLVLSGPVKQLLAHRGVRQLLRRRRSSAGGKLPKVHGSDDEGDEPIDVDVSGVPRPPQLHPQRNSTALELGGANAVASAASGDGMQQAGKPGSSVERVRLEWQQISCFYEGPQGRIVVLQDVWGQAEPGEMQALLGPSGAGKSTLMDILAQRKSTGNLSGFLLVNGQPATSTFIRKTAYVPQEDNFVATMTTSETLNFYASIILPSSQAKAERKQRVADVLAAMGLKHRQQSLVGGTLPGGLMLRGLSGGERKRLSIAAGNLATPSIIFLDEPTSGLDSFAALTVMGYLQRMARDKGHAVIASIHQPRSAIWCMFEKVTLVASGRLMFHGPRDNLVAWFNGLGYRYDPALHGVASDWALDLVAIGFHKPVSVYGRSITTMEQLQAASCQFVASYRAHSGAVLFRSGSDSMMIGTKSLKTRVRSRMQRMAGTRSVGGAADPGLQVYVSGTSDGGSNSSAGEESGGGGAAAAGRASAGNAVPPSPAGADGSDGQQLSLAARSKWATGWWRQFASCYARDMLAVTRNPADVAGRILTFTWVGLLTGVLFYSLSGTASSLMSRLNLLFSNLAFVTLMPYISMSLYTADKKFYLADASAKLYRTHAYYAAKVAVTMPFNLASALIFSFTVYGMAGLRPGARFIWQNGVLNALLSMISVQVLHGAAMLAPNQDLAFMLSICWTAVQLLMSNFFIVFTDVKLYGITQLRWISALYFAFEGVALTEFKGMVFACSRDGIADSTIASLRYLLPRTKFLSMPLFVNALRNPDPDCIANANALLRMYDYGRPFQHTFGILLGYLGLMHALTYMWMVIVSRHEQR